MDKIGTFTLEKVVLNKMGELAVIGTVDFGSRLSRLLRPKYELGIRRRGEQSTRWVPAQITEATVGRFSIRATVDASGGDEPAGYSDVYFRRAGEAAENAQRVHFPVGGRDWSAYPTKFGNVSFKRGIV
ncbi:hypothetical protein JTF08_06225 [Micrococcaceae bacterium RIT802]|nr:hypothetical protein [Micrococcaceae bacterium RIT 802]